MPFYDYRCAACGHQFGDVYKISDRKVPEQEPCPKCGVKESVQQVILSAPATCDSVRIGVTKQDSGFKEVLQKIHQSNAGSTLDTYL